MKNYNNIFGLLLLVSVGLSCSEEKKKEVELLRPIKYQKVGVLDSENIRTFSGIAQTDKVIALSFRNTGIIAQFDIKLGQTVKKGQLLAQLDNLQSRLAYEQSLTQKNSAQSQFNTTKLSLDRARALYEKGSASLSDFEGAKNAYKTAEQSYESAKRGVSIQQEQMKFGYLYAPESGVISAVNSEIKENVNPVQTIATLNAGTDMKINLGIPESIINKINVGDSVDVTFTSLQGKSFKAKVTEVSPTVSSTTATYPVHLILTTTTNDVKSGMTANVTFDFGVSKASNFKLIIPAYAVGEDHNGRFVFLLVREGATATVKKQPVTIGNLTAQGFEITSGITKGQHIATAGLQTLLDGQKVKL
jgi:multidrug efflux system membrane fusion protein